MTKFIFFLFFLCPYFVVFGQNRKLTFSVFSTEEDCSLIPKELLVSYEVNGQDSIIRKDSITNCLIEIDLPEVAGSYRVSVSAENYKNAVFYFDVTDSTSRQLTQPPIELKKDISQLDLVTITGIKRSFIQVDADKTTITVKDNPVLTVSSIYDAILKIPGVVPYPGGGFTVAGKNASIYFEGIPSNLSGDDLTNLLKSLPASSVETIEIISNPGASYDANVSGSIINVISLGRVTKWFSGTITLNYGLNANNKILPSVVLSGRAKKYSWQLQAGYSFYERSFHTTSAKNFTTFTPVAQLYSDRKEQNTSSFAYFKPTFNYKLNDHSNLILSYNGSLNSTSSTGASVSSSNGITPAVGFLNTYKATATGLNNELVFKYRNKLDTLKRVLEFTAYYSNYSQERLSENSQLFETSGSYSLLNNELDLRRLYLKSDLELPFPKIKLYVQTGLKYSKLFANSLGRYNLQSASDAVFQDPSYNSSLDFDYTEDNLAGYAEAKKGFGKKLSIGAGLRVENFSLKRSSSVSTKQRTDYFNFFPSFNGIYRFSPDVNFIATYSRKISIPSYSQFDPNNSGYYDAYNSSTGNLLLSPNFFDNVEVKFTVFDYLQLSMDYSHSQTLNLSEVIVQPNSLQASQTFRTYHDVNTLTYFLSVPVPFGLFRQGLEFFNNAIDIDKINFLYLYTERTKTTVSDYTYLAPNKAMWTYGVYSQFILPWEIRMNVDYYITSKGTYQIYDLTKTRSSLDIILSKSFMKNKLKASVSVDDLFNTSQSTFRTSYQHLDLENYSKDDTRIIWFKFSWSFGRYEKFDSENTGPDPGKTQDLNNGLK